MFSTNRIVMPVLVLYALTANAIAEPATPIEAGGQGTQPAVASVMPSTADHRKFKALQRQFKSGPEVTEACLSCHTESAKQVQHTKHWTWESVDPQTGQKRGKRNIINNFCTSVVSNEADCMACHAGYGWKDDSFDFTAEKNVDCLVCHDTTGTYRKLPGFAGHPVYKPLEFPPGSGRRVEAVDLQRVAQTIGMPSRTNCGSCHFFGAGGNGAKHGDLDSSLQHPGKYLDVHMDEKGLNFSCQTCHATSKHQVSGSRYNMAAAPKGGAHMRGTKDTSPASCQSCHGNKPHPAAMTKLNQHTDKIACQTCHIPAVARNEIGTELSWDWSDATKMGPDGKPLLRMDSAGRRAFDSRKGSFVWDSYVIPEYRWFNGIAKYKVIGDKIDPTQTVQINEFGGSANDPESRIWPVKVHRGKQPYDKINLTLTLQHTGGEDDTALWHNYDWQKAITTGMKAGGLPYSGEFGFVSTEHTWPITHMVAPKGDALSCAQCHSKNGRLKDVEGVYIPARDGSKVLDILGWTLALLALMGVFVHGGIRIIAAKRG
jgi:octaheme c-type cytochrome (tetrathionate reductase family)